MSSDLVTALIVLACVALVAYAFGEARGQAAADIEHAAERTRFDRALRAKDRHFEEWAEGFRRMHQDSLDKLERDCQQRADAAVADVMARYCREATP